jgi:hypothetical protein
MNGNHNLFFSVVETIYFYGCRIIKKKFTLYVNFFNIFVLNKICFTNIWNKDSWYSLLEPTDNTATLNTIHSDYIQIIPTPHQNVHYCTLPSPCLRYSHLLKSRFIAQMCTRQYFINIKTAILECVKLYLKSSGLNIPWNRNIYFRIITQDLKNIKLFLFTVSINVNVTASVV